jgi:hypothetical protein
MTDEAISPLRRRMIEDMTIRKLAPKTQQGYIRTIKDFAVFLGRSPDTASFEDIRRFQLHLAQSGAQAPIVNHMKKIAAPTAISTNMLTRPFLVVVTSTEVQWFP